MEKSIIEKLEEIKRNTKLRIEEAEKNRQQIIDERNRQKQLEKEIKEKEYRRKETFLKIIKNEVIWKLQKAFIGLCAYIYIINIFIILGVMIFIYLERFAKLDSTNHIVKGVILGISVFIPTLNNIFSRINYTLFNSHSIFYSFIYTLIGLIIFSYVVLILFSIFFRIKKVSISKTKFWEKHEAQYGKYRQFIDFSNNEMAIITAYEKYLSQKIFTTFIFLLVFAVIIFGVMGFFILYFPFFLV